jgi:Ca-activated chloride channel family protein
MMQLDWPWALLLLPLPLLIRFLMPAVKRQDAALRVPIIDDFKTASSIELGSNKNYWLLALATIAWCCLMFAAARPQWLGDQVDIPVSGRDLMLAVDLSGSMQIPDFEINGKNVDRLTAVKQVASEFIARRSGDRVGLILFGEQAYLQTPLTFDLKTVNTLLDEAFIGMAGDATSIGDAIGLAIKRLQDKQKNSRVLILLTDGANTAGEVTPIKAAELAADQGLKIYTIGIGADELLRRTLFGVQRLNPSADLDEKTLRAIADKTGGKYFRAHDTKELDKIYNMLDELEPVEQESESFRPISALFYWPLGVALGIGGLIGLLRARGLAA